MLSGIRSLVSSGLVQASELRADAAQAAGILPPPGSRPAPLPIPTVGPTSITPTVPTPIPVVPPPPPTISVTPPTSVPVAPVPAPVPMAPSSPVLPATVAVGPDSGATALPSDVAATSPDSAPTTSPFSLSDPKVVAAGVGLLVLLGLMLSRRK